jgi:tRNA-(ms[2]io[6]A)-hydroxylase
MLGLQCSTSEEWIAAVNRNPATVLRDHAHCEKKAATMAISLLNRYPGKTDLVAAMAELAEEELGHFRMVIAKMTERGIDLTPDRGDHYARQLHDLIRKREPQRLLDTLLVSSLIEARSCERFSLLSASVEDADLRAFYRSLLESEARHRTEFLSLARTYFDRTEVDARLDELESAEASIIQSLTHEPVMHG